MEPMGLVSLPVLGVSFIACLGLVSLPVFLCLEYSELLSKTLKC